MTIPELYELFIHNPKVTTDSRNCPRGSIFFALKMGINSMVTNMQKRRWHPVACMR